MSPRVPDRPASSWVQVGASRCPGGLCALERFEREGKVSRWVGRAGPYLEGLGQVSRDFAQACGLPKVHEVCFSGGENGAFSGSKRLSSLTRC